MTALSRLKESEGGLAQRLVDKTTRSLVDEMRQ